ncbi:hypothetical protein VJ923_10380 [Adlercreutzia sp. R25]|uniref:hypothetical protein n=1 Tax=Adlercreutzia shanghongiae TaxID=3111773 RepID=UPI002DBC805E|nr:hypothetical protein [Adlercreutzia sp. R25]MEC4273565.1 hypothetical protein [Adlercreutzia sp. R25]
MSTIIGCFIRDLKAGSQHMALSIIAAFTLAIAVSAVASAPTQSFGGAFSLLFFGAALPTPNTPFHVPLDWLGLLMCPVFSVAFYPSFDLKKQGSQSVTRASSWLSWLIAKMLWVTSVLSLDVVAYLSVAEGLSVLSFLDGNCQMETCRNLSFILNTVLVLFTFGFCSFAFSLLLSPLIGVVANILYAVLSSYSCNALLLGNFAMSERFTMIEAPFNEFLFCPILCLTIISASTTLCFLAFPKKDVF